MEAASGEKVALSHFLNLVTMIEAPARRATIAACIVIQVAQAVAVHGLAIPGDWPTVVDAIVGRIRVAGDQERRWRHIKRVIRAHTEPLAWQHKWLRCR